MSSLYVNETLFFNIVNVTLFITGLVGLTTGNLTAARDLPIRGQQARIVGAILLMPVFCQALGLASWFDLLPALLSIFGCLAYLFLTTSSQGAKTYVFWFAAVIPALSAYMVAYLVTVVTNSWLWLLYVLRTLPLSDASSALLTIFLSECLVPFVVALILSRLMHVSTSMSKALIFAVPLLLFYLQGTMPSWLSAIDSIEHPEVPHPPGSFEWAVAYTTVVFFLFVSIVFAGRFGPQDHLTEQVSA